MNLQELNAEKERLVSIEQHRTKMIDLLHELGRLEMYICVEEKRVDEIPPRLKQIEAIREEIKKERSEKREDYRSIVKKIIEQGE